jgi:hypothetical protein
MVHPDRLNSEEIKDLWSEADHDGDDIVDYKEFQVIPCVIFCWRFCLELNNNMVPIIR